MQLRADGHNAGRVDIVMRVVIMTFDVVEVDGLFHPGGVVKGLKKRLERRIVDDPLLVALEVAEVDEQKDQGL